jgi:hypothetical protein
MRTYRRAEPAVPSTTARRPTRPAPDAPLADLQRTIGNGAVARMVASSVDDVLRAPGRPLADSVRADLEGRLGADFGTVRVHTGPAAERSAAELGARAWTAGEHVVIGSGGADRHTLAHELTHVVQQRSGLVAGTDIGAGLRVSDPADPFERAAEANAARVMSGLAPNVHDTGTPGAPSIQRFSKHSEGGVDYLLSANGRFAILDSEEGGRQIWAQPGVTVSDSLAHNPAGDRLINGKNYQEYQIRRWLLKDCLHAAEEIINNLPGELPSGHELPATATGDEGRYSLIHGKGKGKRKFGDSDEANIKNARESERAKNKDANPGVDEAFIIVATKVRKKAMSPYHAAAVVGVDGNDRITLEEWDSYGEVSRGVARMYTVGSTSKSFHGVWGGRGRYFGSHNPITVVLEPMRHPSKARKRTTDTDVFTENTFGDETDRETSWK